MALGPAAATAATPSPADWRDVVIYQVVTDRFADGNPANNALEGNYAPADGGRIHGGDFAGIEARLDYLVHLGVDALWISPVVLNANAEYHGYAARDLFAIAPHFGTLAELQSMVAAAHARGIYVLIDVVVNHMGDLIDSGNSGYPAFRYPSTYTLRWRNAGKRYYGILDDLTKFHAHGHIGSFTDPEQIVGELFGLDDLKTADPEVRTVLEQASDWLIANTDCDGYRIDTVKHVEMDFWNQWCPAVHADATAFGKSDFFLFGEVFDGSDAKCGSYTGTVGGGNYKLDSVLHYSLYWAAGGVFLWDDAPANLSGVYANLGEYDPTSRERLVTFLDNHDNSRFLRAGPAVAVQDESRLRAALGWLLTSRGVPSIYYGTEQEFDGGGDPYNREDMWDGQWDFGPSDGDNFDLTHPLFLYTRRLTEARRRHLALRRGTTTELTVASGGPGLYLYERRAAGDTVLVAVNTSNLPITVGSQATPWPSGTALLDALDAQVVEPVGPGGTISLKVPARAVRVLESYAHWLSSLSTRELQVVSATPGHDQNLNDRSQPLTLVFDRVVDAASLTTGFGISPAMHGAWAVSGEVARFYPDTFWSSGVTYRWGLLPSVRGADGRTLAARFDSHFRTAPYATGVTVAPGYSVDRIAQQGLAAPEGIIDAPELGPQTLLVSDTGRDRLYTLTPGGDLGHDLGDARWGKPEGLARMPNGTAVIDQNGVFAIDQRHMTTSLAGASGASSTGAAAWGKGAYGDRLYLADPANDRIVYVNGGVLQTFATGVLGAEGLAIGQGSAWGHHLYVADANLASLGTPANGPGRIARVDSAGMVTTVVQNAGLLGGASAMAFDPGSAFGGHLYVADILNERILQVTAAGAVSVFASGFRNLSGSHCLAFGRDGALYVADAGSGQSFSYFGPPNNPPQILRIAYSQLTTEVPEPEPRTLELAAPVPNPFASDVLFRWVAPAGGKVALDVFDLSGRRVRSLMRGTPDAAQGTSRWDGTDDQGRPLRSGVYLARLSVGLRTVTRRVVLTR